MQRCLETRSQCPSAHIVALVAGERYVYVLNIVPLLPPAPAALVLLGRALEARSALSAAAFLLIAVAGPPGGFGEEGRAVVVPEGVLTGEVGRGDDCRERGVERLIECSDRDNQEQNTTGVAIESQRKGETARPSRKHTIIW